MRSACTWHFVALVIVCARLKQRRRVAGNQFKHGTFGSCFVMNFFHFLFLVLFNWTCRAKGACVPEDARGNEEESKEKVGSTHDTSTGPVVSAAEL